MTASVLQGLIAGLGGLLFGLGYFHILARSVAFLLQPGRRTLGVVLSVARLGTAALLLFLAAKIGVVALLSGLVGFLAARTIALRRQKEAAP